MWLHKLQIAIIEKNIDSLEKLLESMPTFNSSKEIETAGYLLKEAVDLVNSFKDETAVTMMQLKKNIDFMKSTAPQKITKLDIKL